VPEGYATRAQVARALGVRPELLARWERSGRVPSEKRGCNVLYNTAAYQRARTLADEWKAKLDGSVTTEMGR
jgi:hypothetical protein